MAEPSDVTVPPPQPPDPPNANPDAENIDLLSSSPNTSSSTPPWVVWSRGLNALLDDPQGQDLFKTYLEENHCHYQLTFLWACEGLKCASPQKIPGLVRKICLAYIDHLLGLSDDSRIDLTAAIDNERFGDIEIFAKAKEDVLNHMREHLYPNFLQSELYLAACAGEEIEICGASSSASSGSREAKQSEEGEDEISTEPKEVPMQPDKEHHEEIIINQLQTVHEDRELSTHQPIPLQPMPKPKKHFVELTKEALLATEFQRASEFKQKVRKNEASRTVKHLATAAPAGHASSGGPSVPFPYHASYNSYNPVSRVDSEIASMSSGAMTDADDGGPSGSRRRHHGGHGERVRHPAEEQPRHVHRTAAGQSSHHQNQGQGLRQEGDRFRCVLPPGTKLNCGADLQKQHPFPVPRQQTNRKNYPDPEKFPEAFAAMIIDKLEKYEAERRAVVSASAGQPMSHKNMLAHAIMQLQMQEKEEPNEIIDLHFDRVPYLADITPKSKSPKLRSPTAARRRGPLPPLPPAAAHSALPPTKRRDRDFTVSTSTLFSIDSGNVPDSDSLNPYAFEDSRVGQMPKSRSVPYQLRGHGHGHDRYPPLPTGQQLRGYHHYSLRGHPHPPMFKRPSTEFLDSGISVVSGATGMMPPPPSRPQAPGLAPEERRVRDWIIQSQSSDRLGPPVGSPPSQRRLKKVPSNPGDFHSQVIAALDSRAVAPRHSPPNLENVPTVTTTVIVSYDDNKDVPYSLKFQVSRGIGLSSSGSGSSGITLAEFKKSLPRQGEFRYFFHTDCPELESRVVQEEISDDIQELPMHKGKVFAHLKAVSSSSTTTTGPIQL